MKSMLIAGLSLLICLSACTKSNSVDAKSQLDGQSSALLIDWTDAQIRLIRNTTGVTHPAFSRHFSYTSIALYESLVHGDKKMKSIAPSLNGAPQLPTPPNENRIFYPAAANSAIATMFRHFYAAKEANLQLIDSLENAIKSRYLTEVKSKYDLEQSASYGKNVATLIIDWSKTDGASNANIPYTPKGEGFWEPTPPANASPAVPGWGANRPLLIGSAVGTEPAAPPVFSKDPSSAFYKMSKEVYDVSLALTQEQKNIANFWDDLPNGKYISVYGHWFSILKQILQKEKTPLMKAAEAYLRLGITMNESTITCWRSKYAFHQMRPITYIRKYMEQGTWNSYIATPAHPEYLAAHATFSASAAGALESVFGKNFPIEDRTYQSLGMATRTYPNIEAAATEAGMSRVYGGIHFRPTVEAGKIQGLKVAENVKNILVTRKQ
jgi:PAP2 superfamily